MGGYCVCHLEIQPILTTSCRSLFQCFGFDRSERLKPILNLLENAPLRRPLPLPHLVTRRSPDLLCAYSISGSCRLQVCRIYPSTPVTVYNRAIGCSYV
ncbi:hypothetical protein CDEST_13698 [Colletotrichum destructivum]|uniref:Uncharacterized protein n=1 Tax=Colletotrichum destructivum TaxID=34406 RepID=A0AAX4IZN8_9PEZI|nr:hypothetical protein CDEST_13698 [Colletotrichum destructivum]